MKSAWLVKEAPLPDGFPPPGPVGVVVVKEYPRHRAASVNAEAVGEADANRMFRPLFDHIKRNGIAMTAPVEMGYVTDLDQKPRAESMAFMYSSPQLGKTGDDGQVKVEDVDPMLVTSVALRGRYTAARFEKGLEQVHAWLREHEDEYEQAGPPRYLAYNSPFVLWFMKLGEVQVPVKKRLQS